MKTKITSISIVTIAVAIGYVVSSPLIFHICNNTYQFGNYTGCLDGSIKSTGSPLLIFSLWILFVTAAMTFFSEKIFRSWLRLSMWAIPLATIFIAITPVSSSSYMDLFPFYRDDAARLAGQVFLAISLAPILYKYFSLRRSR